MIQSQHPRVAAALWRQAVGMRMQQLRKSLGITQQEMATRLDLTNSTITILENGKMREVATVEQHVRHACKVLGSDVEWILNGHGESPKLPPESLNRASPKRSWRQSDRIERKLDAIIKHFNIEL